MEGSFVLPGDVVGSAEEFVPGDCTYAKGGVIFASTAGLVKVDPKTRSRSSYTQDQRPCQAMSRAIS